MKFNVNHCASMNKNFEISPAIAERKGIGVVFL